MTSTTATADAKLDVIRKLLAKAEGAATPAEADAYNAKASELMARHGVDSALLAAAGQVRDDIGQRKIRTPNPYPRAKADLVARIASALRCQVVYHGATGTRCNSVTIMGYESDLQRVELLYTSLLLQGTRQIVHARPEWWSDESPAAYRRTWWDGFSSVIGYRLRQAERAAVQDRGIAEPGSGAELVLADRQQLVAHAYEQAFPKLKAAPDTPSTGSGAYAGSEAGKRADIGRPRMAAGSRRELGA